MSIRLPGYEDTVVCPYNKSHVILRSRFQTHLVKCARSNPGINLVTCPFDNTHRMREEELQAHTEKCPSRENLDRFLFSVATNSTSQQQEPPVQRRPPPPPTTQDDEENWDHLQTPTYDPQRYAQQARVLRAPRNLTPAERRQFADDERRRLSTLEHRQHQQPRM